MTRLSDERREDWARQIAEEVLMILDYSDVGALWDLDQDIEEAGADKSEEYQAILNIITERARVSFL